MKKLPKVIAVAVLVLGLGSGVASASTGTIGTTGPDSNNQVTVNNTGQRHVNNTNRVDVENGSYQRASSGDAKVWHNTTGGSAESGEVMNDNLTRATVNVSNANSSSAVLGSSSTGSDTGTINNTGPDSNNQVTFNNATVTTVDNDNCITVDNWSSQHAYSGDAKVYDNTTGGSATSGAATNINTSEFSITVSN